METVYFIFAKVCATVWHTLPNQIIFKHKLVKDLSVYNNFFYRCVYSEWYLLYAVLQILPIQFNRTKRVEPFCEVDVTKLR